jgi:hypothetical protein
MPRAQRVHVGPGQTMPMDRYNAMQSVDMTVKVTRHRSSQRHQILKIDTATL